MRKASRNGATLRYSVEGGGPPVIAISGLMSTVESSQFRFVPGLADRYQLVYGEHRGAGQSSAPPGPYTVEGIADDWVAIMDAAEIDRAPIMGNSFGSMIAQRIALKYPERVSRLVLSVPVCYADPRLFQLVSHWLRTFSALGEREFAMQAMLWTLTPTAFAEQASIIVDSLDDDLPKISEEGFRGQVSALTEFDTRDQLNRIGVPTLIIAGAEDQVCPPYHAEQLSALIPGSELVILHRSGHLPQTEQGDEYAAALLPFLAEDSTTDATNGGPDD